jgi:3-deoxy-D-manno-octulosonic-acid transferase
VKAERQSEALAPDWRYRVLSTALAPLAIGHSLWQSLRQRDARIARQRLGIDQIRRDDRPVWIHMASVGEVNAALPLILALRRRGLPVVCSTFTPTGAATVAGKLGAEVEHVYLPLDFPHAVRRFLDGVRPRCALIVETEIWPRLFAQCRRSRIPLLLVNGRLSRRTLDKAAWIREIPRRALRNVDLVLARSAADAAGFLALGVTAERVRVIDNIKFAAPAIAVEPIRLPRPHIVLASSHDDEELRIARAWLDSPLRHSHTLLIAPRHPARRNAILQQLRQLDIDPAVRSKGEAATAATSVYLADTLGELKGFIAGAELVLMGGSLIPRGGQNPIEAAQLGKATIFGPHMENFAEERILLLEHHAAIEVADAAAMIDRASTLIADAERLRETGLRAKQTMAEKGDVVQRYLDALAPWLS